MFDTMTASALAPSNLKANLEAGVYNHVWRTENTRNRRRATLTKADKIFWSYGVTSPEEMPASRHELAFFFERHLQDGNFPISSGLKTQKDAWKWKREYGAILDVLAGVREAKAALRQQEDDWAELLAHLAGQRGAPMVFGTYEMIPVGSLVTQCRLRAISIAELTPEAIHAFASDLPRTTLAAVVKAIVRLNALHGGNTVPDELLPNVRPDDIAGLVQPATRVVPPLHPDFAALTDTYIAEQATGRSVEMFGSEAREIETAALSAARLKNMRTALRWLWHGLVALDLASHETAFDRRLLARPALLSDVVGACAGGLLGPVCDPQTRRDHVMIAISFLTWLDPEFRAKLPRRFYDSVNLRRAPEETEDRQKKRKACLAFIQDEEQQRRFYLLPRLFFDQARPLIGNFYSLGRADGHGVSREQNRALELAIMAALTAINTAFPARLKTLMQLEISGKNPHVLFPEDSSRRETVILNIPGRIMKNGRYVAGVPLEPSKMRNSRQILRWYIDEVHPLVLMYKHKRSDLRRPERLFTGLSIDTIRQYWKHHTNEAGLELTPHMCRHFAASLLLAKGAPLEEIAELLSNSVKVTEANYAFVARNLVIQNVMDAQAEIYRKLGI